MTRPDLIDAIDAGLRPRFLFFWGHHGTGERMGAECLSQWYPARFVVDGIAYPTAEHWMMAGKARTFDDDDALAHILVAKHPAQAKKLGRTVRDFDGPTWDRVKIDIVVAGNVAKFSQDPDLCAYLLGTGERILVEASPRDRIWGIGLGRRSPHATDPRQWKGDNLLGFALMRARSQIRRTMAADTAPG